ncbi:protein transporter Sec31 [Streptomyces kaniharaensis]|uniref:Protein transporter Sec31 n=1 Tax=Streptomyces kaniharaensis TaxID=212423 RepID=A0A6N7KSU0_9ACTN|nr:protein transporter Sec31 [Streptomyces kaniharaensis]MQS14501.1 protein transporter Sec31 [Streptomyces kaniharaensis]
MIRRTRTEQHEQLVPHTINGITEMVTEKYATAVPIPPRDWDRIVRGAVTGATALTVAGSIAWSTASIGDLLSRTVHPVIGYGAAGVFDLAWISCMALEWLARYDRRKAAGPRKAGHVALVIAMAAVCAHGILQGGHGAIVVGIIGALVSALAKGMWTMTMRHHSVELDDRSQQWVEARFSAAHARLATAAVHRELARVDGNTADMQAAYQTTAVEPWPGPDRPRGQRPDNVDPVVRGAILAAIATMPGATPREIVDQLVHARITTDENTVRTVSGQTDSRSATLHDLDERRGKDNISDTVRHLVRTGVTDDDALLVLVRYVHGDDVKPDTVRRLAQRVG